MFNTTFQQGRRRRQNRRRRLSHPLIPSCRAAPSPVSYVEDFAKPKMKPEVVFNIRLVAEMPHGRHNHCQPLFICGFDNFGISNRPARLYDRRNPRLRGGI